MPTLYPRALVAAAATLALALSACGGGDPLASSPEKGSGGTAVTIGSADFTESQLVGSIYSQALKKAGVEVKEQFNIGSREVYIAALKDGSIDLIPEYSGALLKYLDEESAATTSEDVAAELKTKLPEGIAMLTPSDAEDKDVLAVTKETAEKHQLTTISSLAPVAGQLTLGGPAEWKTRVNGVVGLQKVYGLTFAKFVSLDAGGPLTMAALTSGQVQVGDLFSTDPGITQNNLVALEDDKSLFAAENVVPLVRSDKSSATITKTLDAVSAKLTTEDLIAMNGEAATGKNLADIADAWLAKSGL